MEEILELLQMNRPLAQAETLPSPWYWDKEHYIRESRSIFPGTWQIACRIDELKGPGSFVRVKLGNEDAVIVKDKVGEIHAVSNICRHRGTEIIKECSGKIPGFTCRYHGWTYDLDGTLRKAPQFEGVENFSIEKYSLPKFEIAAWGPYFFACNGKPVISFSEYIKPLQESLGNYPLNDLKFIKRVTYDLKCNWKVYVDNYLDGGYHVPSLHKRLASVLDDSQYKILCSDYSVLQSAPISAGKDSGVASVRKGKEALYWWLYPNLMLNFYEGVYDMNLVIPTGPESCRVVFDYFFEDPSNTQWIEESIQIADLVQAEDIEVSESVQRGLNSTTYSRGRYSVKREAGGYLFHQLLAKHFTGEDQNNH